MNRILMVVALASASWLAAARIDTQTSAPSGLAALVTGTSVTLTWQPPSGAVSTYVLEVDIAVSF